LRTTETPRKARAFAEKRKPYTRGVEFDMAHSSSAVHGVNKLVVALEPFGASERRTHVDRRAAVPLDALEVPDFIRLDQRFRLVLPCLMNFFVPVSAMPHEPTT